MADGIAIEGMRLIKESLPRAVQHGEDIEARTMMMAVAAMGAVAFQKGLGAIHALSHPIGALYGTHHGMTNAVFMPYVLAFNRTAIEPRIERAAAYLSLTPPRFDVFMDWILSLRREVGVPHTLEGLGLLDIDIDHVVDMAISDPTAAGNPTPLNSKAARAILESALTGRLAYFL
jgi:alcohol dehydrogenase class IV